MHRPFQTLYTNVLENSLKKFKKVKKVKKNP